MVRTVRGIENDQQQQQDPRPRLLARLDRLARYAVCLVPSVTRHVWDILFIFKAWTSCILFRMLKYRCDRVGPHELRFSQGNSFVNGDMKL